MQDEPNLLSFFLLVAPQFEPIRSRLILELEWISVVVFVLQLELQFQLLLLLLLLYPAVLETFRSARLTRMAPMGQQSDSHAKIFATFWPPARSSLQETGDLSGTPIGVIREQRTQLDINSTTRLVWIYVREIKSLEILMPILGETRSEL